MTFFLITKYWAKDCRQHDNNWHICCCFFLVLRSVKFKKISLWLGSAYNMDIKSVPSPFTFGMINCFNLNWQAWSVNNTTSFSDSLFQLHPKLSCRTYPFFWAKLSGGRGRTRDALWVREVFEKLTVRYQRRIEYNSYSTAFNIMRLHENSFPQKDFPQNSLPQNAGKSRWGKSK